MKQTLSIATRKELAATLATRYASANRHEKKVILDELTATVHYHRKHAIRLFNKQRRNLNNPHAPRRKRPPKYNAEVKDALIAIWKATNYLCSKRLVACLPEFITAMELHGHMSISPETRTKLLSISTATIDRLLYDIRHGRKKRAICTTRPGALLKHQIPIRTFSDWNDLKPGYLKADLVAHCGTSVQGTFLNTLVLTDIATGWRECLALLLRSQDHVLIALNQVRPILPFPLLGLDTDNGSEFLNGELFRYCQNEKIYFTRCRPYRKNDQCHVEQKNGAIVRRVVGYDRYEGAAACKQ
ncbi:MAG: ISNCY family transposase [Acidobacteriota bacterium]